MKVTETHSEPETVADRQPYRVRIESKHGEVIEITELEAGGFVIRGATFLSSRLAIWPEVKVNGTQVVVNGHPAFTFAGDTAAGQTKGQNLKDQWGVWLALDPKGNPITPAASATTTAPNGGGAAF